MTSRAPHPPHPRVDSLPATLPIFPLAGVLLLPHGQLPLNIFEPRYLAMTRDAMGGGRLIGMVQPIDPRQEDRRAGAVYATGCAGRVTAYDETDDGRYLITLTGVCRFAITGELPLADAGYRRVSAAYDSYADDLGAPAEDAVARASLLRALKACLSPDEAGVDWSAVERMTSDNLVTSLAMLFPFSPSEKQALLEAPDTGERARILTTLMAMLAATNGAGDAEECMQ